MHHHRVVKQALPAQSWKLRTWPMDRSCSKHIVDCALPITVPNCKKCSTCIRTQLCRPSWRRHKRLALLIGLLIGARLARNVMSSCAKRQVVITSVVAVVPTSNSVVDAHRVGFASAVIPMRRSCCGWVGGCLQATLCLGVLLKSDT